MFLKEKTIKTRDEQILQERRRGMFSDTTKDYLIPPEPERFSTITIRFRTIKSFEGTVCLVCGEEKIRMERETSVEQFIFWKCQYALKDQRITYYFEIEEAGKKEFFDMRGLIDEPDDFYGFKVIPGFSTPDWAKGAVFYQIYVDRFYNGDPSNDVLTGEYKYIDHLVEKKRDWKDGTSITGIGEFYGGDLAGVMQKLDYLEDLGIEVIYFNPLFVSPSNHKYDIQDYHHIDPHFGKLMHDQGDLLTCDEQKNAQATRYIDRVTNPANLEASDRLFIELVEEAHKRGMKVILDGVFNHCGSFNRWMDREDIYGQEDDSQKGAYLSKKSRYREYFYFSDQDDCSYEGWWGYKTLPKLNYDSDALYDDIMEIARKWVSAPFCADGWRLDVAADLGASSKQNHQFWQDFRKNVKSANPNALILAEHYGDPKEWLLGNEWDSVMNYDAFMEPVTWFLTGMEKHSDAFRPEMVGDVDAFWEAMIRFGTVFTNSSLNVAMNELSNHDHSRFITRTSRKVGRITTMGAQAADRGNRPAVFREAVVIQMTWPGAPTIYYGDEAGLCGFTDPDNRRTYPWGKEDHKLIAFHKDVIRIHKEHEELRSGSLKRLDSSHNILAYGRMNEKNACVILINNRNEAVDFSVSVWELGIPMNASLTRILYTHADGYTVEEKKISVMNGTISLQLLPNSAMICSI